MTIKEKQLSYSSGPINKFFTEDSSKFKIPIFQREFVWRSEEVIQLLKDLEEDSEGFSDDGIQNSEGYLLGSIVLIEESGEYLVVDGQQRLTTLSLIFKCLHEIITQKVNEESNSALQWTLQYPAIIKGFHITKNNGTRIVGNKIIHEDGLKWGNTYYKIINNDKELNGNEPSDDALKDVYNASKNYLDDLNNDQLLNFISYLTEKVSLIFTIATSPNKAFQFFEVLNDRGRSLEPLDLVKNLFLKRLHSDDESSKYEVKFIEYWNEFHNNLTKDSRKKIESSTFLKHFILGTYGKSIKKDMIYSFFNYEKNNDKNQESLKLEAYEIQPFMERMVKASLIYKEIENGIYTNFGNENKMFLIFSLFKLNGLHPLFIPFYDKEDNIRDEILNLGVKYAASCIFSLRQMNKLEADISSFMKKYHEDLRKDHKNAYTNLKNSIKRKIKENILEMKDLLPRKKLNNTKVIQIFGFIELDFFGNLNVKKTGRNEKPTWEHIFSQEIIISEEKWLEETGFNDKVEASQYLDTIGNATILTKSDNSTIGNEKFINKISTYENQSFEITKKIVKKLKANPKTGNKAMKIDLINEKLQTFIDFDKEGNPMVKIVNQNKESKYIENINGHFGKEMIKERSENIVNFLSHLLSEE